MSRSRIGYTSSNGKRNDGAIENFNATPLLSPLGWVVLMIVAALFGVAVAFAF